MISTSSNAIPNITLPELQVKYESMKYRFRKLEEHKA
jgi:hypothetical protein